MDIRRKRKLQFLFTAGRFLASTAPFHLTRMDTVLMLDQTSQPETGCHLVLRNADPLAPQVLGF